MAGLTEEKIKILKAIIELGGEARAKEIAEKIGFSPQKVAAHLRALKNQGYVEPVKKGVYRITEAGRKAVEGK